MTSKVIIRVAEVIGELTQLTARDDVRLPLWLPPMTCIQVFPSIPFTVFLRNTLVRVF